MPESSVLPTAIYQLRVVLCGLSPLVWRRLLVASATSIAELHEILQKSFDWSSKHLHRFLIHGTAYGIPYPGGIGFRENARGMRLSRFRLHRGERFRYEYDFMAHWKLHIRLERILPFDPDRVLPSCIGGSRAAPPEDCTGALDYLDSNGARCAIGDLDERREAVDRVKAYQDFQPDKFDRRELNLRLRALIQDREVRR